LSLTQAVDYSLIGASQLFRDYLQGHEPIMPFFQSGHFTDFNYWESKIKRRESFIKREQLVEALLDFHNPFNASENTLQQIKSLADEQTFTVVTGQQLTLFGGPLYTLLKTITAVKTAKILSKRFNVKVIPVFWLADEDHDFQEIAKVNVPGKDELIPIQLKSNAKTGFAAGKLELDESVIQLLNTFSDQLPDTEFKAKVSEMLHENWMVGASWKVAFGNMMLHFFGDEGLILAGSDHPQIKKSCTEIMLKSVSENVAFQSSLQQTTARLEQDWFAQAQTGESSLFFHDENSGRIKITPVEERWKAGNHTWDTSELMELIQNQPERFSPNVFLRPLVQEFLLPNLAYVGGPAEIAYHAQLGSNFKLFGLEMPVLIPRLSLTVAEPPIERIFSGLPFSFEDYMKRIEDLQQEFIQQHAQSDLNQTIEDWKSDVEVALLSKESFLESLDASLTGSLKGLTAKTLNEIDKLNQKLNRSLKQQESVQLNRLQRVKYAFFPENNPQERVISWVWFISKYGNAFINHLNLIITDDFESLKKHHLVYLSKMNT